MLGLLGPNGAGKTTAVRILSTILDPDGGRAADPRPRRRAPRPTTVRRLIGLAGQYATVDENLTGRENLRMVGPALPHRQAPVARRAPTSCSSVRPDRRGQPPAQDLLGRHAAPARPGGGPRRPAAGALLRRADDRASTPRAARTCGLTIEAPGARRHDGPAHHPVPRGGRPAGRPDRRRRPRHGHRRGHARRAQGRPRRDGHRGRAWRTPSGASQAAGLLGDLPGTVRVDGSERRADRRRTGRRWPPRCCAPSTPHGVEVAGLALREPSLDDVFLLLTGHRAEGDGAHRPTPAVSTRAASTGQAEPTR